MLLPACYGTFLIEVSAYRRRPAPGVDPERFVPGVPRTDRAERRQGRSHIARPPNHDAILGRVDLARQASVRISR